MLIKGWKRIMNKRNFNRKQISEILYYVAGIGFFLTFAQNHNAVYMCLGALCLCLGAAHKEKKK